MGTMSDVLIKGMEMPKDKPIRIVLNPNGQLFVDHGVHFTEYEAVELPPHGDLIGREWLIDIALHLMHTSKNDDIANGVKWLWQYIIDAPTIIQAEPCKEKGE